MGWRRWAHGPPRPRASPDEARCASGKTRGRCRAAVWIAVWIGGGGKCRLLLPGACEPRLTRLSARALVSILRTAYAASATGARLSLATVHFAPITVVAHRDKDQLVHSLSILFHPHKPPTKGDLVEVSASQPSPVQLVKLPFMSIAPEGAKERYGGGRAASRWRAGRWRG